MSAGPEHLGRRVAITSLWTAADFATAFVAGFLLAAIFIRTLGPTAYGVYLVVLLIGAPGLLSLVDLGMGGVIVTFTARYRAEGSERLPRFWRFATTYFVALATLVPTATTLVIAIFRKPITASLHAVDVSTDILIVVVVLQALSLITLMFEYLLAGMFDYRPIQVSSITMQIIRVAGSWWLLTSGAELVAVVIWMMTCSAGRVIFLFAWTVGRYRALLHPTKVRWDEVRTWLRYSTSLLARNVAGLVFNFSDRLLITAALPVSQLARYDIAAKPANMVRALLSISTSAVVTASATASGFDRRDQLREFYLRGGRLATVMFMPPLVFLLVHMPNFIALWVGPAFAGAAPVGQLFLASFALAMVPAIGDAMVLGIGEAQRTVKVTWIAAAINLGISVSLVVPLGILGVVLGTTAGAVLSDVWLSKIHLRLLDVAPYTLVREVVRPVFLTAAVSLAAIVLFRSLLGASTWSAFLLSAILTAAASYGLAWRIALTTEDRSLIVGFARYLGSGWDRSPKPPPDDGTMEPAPIAGDDRSS